MATKTTKAAAGTVATATSTVVVPNEVNPEDIERHYTFRNVAKFRKVSYEQYAKDMRECGFYLPDNEMKEAYDAIKIPVRATQGSAGYDFFSPIPFALRNMTVAPRGITFPTGIQCELAPGFCLFMLPKSGLGIRQYSRLGNCIGLIDRDYIFSDNEGDIYVNLRSDIPGNPPVDIHVGQAICQGIILPFCVVDKDETTEKRNGGLGSTGK